MSELELYKQWNDAFFDHFFGDERDNVVLYVDNGIINDIGHRLDPEDDDPINSFFTTVLMSPEQRRSFAKEIHTKYGITLVQDDIINNNIFFLAKELAEKGNNPKNQFFRLPCFNFLVFIIYTFQYGLEDERNESPQWKLVSDVIKYYLDERISTSDRSTTVDFLFKAVSSTQPTFDSNLRTGIQPYVGRIKYQFVLNNSERRLLYDIMASHKLRWDEDRIGYAEFANRNILPYLAGNRYESLRNKILESDNNVFFRNIISLFDPLVYQTEEIQDNRIHGTLLYIYSLEKKCFMIGLDMNLEDDLQIGDMYFAPEREFYGLYLSDCERINQITSLRIETENKHICTIDDEVKYFELKGLYYIQCTVNDPQNGRSYLVVSDDEGRLRNAVNGQNGNDINIQEIGYNYQYFVPSWTVNEGRNAPRIVRERSCSFGFGIKNPSKTNSYYPEGVPSIVISNDMIEEIRSIKVICKQIGHPDVCHVINNLKRYEGNILFYRLPNDLLQITDPYKLEVYILMNNDTEEIVGVINIQPCHIDNYARSSYVYDKWNRTLPRIPQQGPYYQNNKVYRSVNNNHQRRFTITQTLSQEPREDMMMLANILFVVFNQESEINDEKLNNIIKYVGGYFNFDAGDYKVKNSLKHSLLILGFMSRSFTNGYVYRPNNTRVVRTNRSLNAHDNECLLYGTYSIHEIRKLENAGCFIMYRWPYHESELNKRPFLRCLPDLILVGNYDPQRIDISYVDYPLADDLIDFIGNMHDFENVFLPRNGFCGEHYVNQDRLPYYNYNRERKRYQLETERGTYYDYEFANGEGNPQFFRLPEAFIKLYCQNEHNQPVCLVRVPQRTGDEYPSIYFERYSMGLPRLLQKALCELNLGIPSLKYVFPIDRFIGGGSLYSQLYEYSVDPTVDDQERVRNLKKDIVEKLSGHRVEDIYHDNSVSVISNAQYLSNYKMKLLKFQRDKSANQYTSLVLYYTYYTYNKGFGARAEKIIAFSIEENNSDVVYGTTQNYSEEITIYKRILNSDVNIAFSSMIKNRKVDFGKIYASEIPSEQSEHLKSSTKVEIMDRVNNN